MPEEKTIKVPDKKAIAAEKDKKKSSGPAPAVKMSKTAKGPTKEDVKAMVAKASTKKPAPMKANDEYESDDISYRYNSDNSDLPEMRKAGNLILDDKNDVEVEPEPEPKKVVKVKMMPKVKINVASALKNKLKEKTQPD